MPLDGLASGIDHKVTFTDQNGVENFSILENFTAKEDAPVDKIVAMDGNVRHPKFHQGWSGSFTVERNSPFQDAYFAAQESSYYQGLDQIPVTITETITENDGTVTQWQFSQVVLVFEDMGNYSGTEIVRQRVSFFASRRFQLVNP